MRSTSLAAVVLSIISTLALMPAFAADLKISVTGVSSADGQIMVALYNSAETYLGKPFRAAAAPAVAGAMQIEFKDLPAGDYAFSLYHDANANGKMDRNLIGMPTEDYAFSNNAMGKRGAPEYAAARFTLPAAGASTSVSLR
ncbi:MULTISPECIES: DUF2141 domain-containing protein [unclassified Duganella]|uniref:DUF2141 domain-containing protein n=1 Tax=unclassified Duganella TaxID=2636909 RepID=UPI000E355CE8|nr:MULTISPECIES: DUF2141 domain-containing protein [unclassified Duganella]RFP19407.1 DUF2141 domain-containing protein [Duganella sp. BJB475]RFP35988.1 DUF2141 domain-containing protein [Duganella sp. BJB476]